MIKELSSSLCAENLTILNTLIQSFRGRYKVIMVSTIISVALIASPLVASARATPNTLADFPAVATAPVHAGVDAGLGAAFEFIESIPESVLQDEKIYRAWLENNMPATMKGHFRTNWWACGVAVGGALVSALPPLKILKLQASFKAAGGAIKFFQIFKPAFDAARARGTGFTGAVESGTRAAAGASWPETQQALLDLFGVGVVITSCGLGD